MTNKNCHKNRGAAEIFMSTFYLKKKTRGRIKHLLYLDWTQKSYASQYNNYFDLLCSCKRQTITVIFTHDIVSLMSKLQKLASTPYTPTTHDTRSPHACESIKLIFFIPTRMRHLRSIHHVVEVVYWHFRADDVSSKGRLSLPVSSVCNGGKPGRQVCMMSGLSGDARTTSFRPWSCRCHARGWENIFHPFFKAIDGNVLQSSNLESCFVDACENGSVVNEPCVTQSSAFFREKTMTNQGHLCCDLELKRLQPVRQQRDEPQGLEPGPSRRLVKMFHPQRIRSDKSPGSDGSGWLTNFVNLKKKNCFEVSCFKNCF